MKVGGLVDLEDDDGNFHRLIGDNVEAFSPFNSGPISLFNLIDLHPLAIDPVNNSVSDQMVTSIRFILSWMSFRDVLKAQLVCKKFLEIVRSVRFWTLYFEKIGLIVPERLKAVLSSPMASYYLLRMHRRLEIFKTFFDGATFVTFLINSWTGNNQADMWFMHTSRQFEGYDVESKSYSSDTRWFPSILWRVRSSFNVTEEKIQTYQTSFFKGA